MPPKAKCDKISLSQAESFLIYMKYVLGIIAALLGVGMVLKTQWLIENFGTNNWAEEHLGYNGGSRLLYKLIGLVLIFIGFLLITNLFGGFLIGTVGKIFIR